RMPTYLVAGLGNPGAEYEWTRHNAGFLAVGRLLEMAGGGPWRMDDRRRCRMAEMSVEGNKVWLSQPTTYMNNSGQSVAAVVQYYKIPLERLLVVVDDSDLPLGRLRMRPSGTSGGHHGLESI